MGWIGRFFTLPRHVREQLNANPLVHLLGFAFRGLAVSVAQGVVDKHVSDPGLAARLKDGIEQEIHAAIPIDDPTAAPVNPEGLLIPAGAPATPSGTTLSMPGPAPAPPVRVLAPETGIGSVKMQPPAIKPEIASPDPPGFGGS